MSVQTLTAFFPHDLAAPPWVDVEEDEAIALVANDWDDDNSTGASDIVNTVSDMDIGQEDDGAPIHASR